MIKINNVTKYFKINGEKKYILKNINLVIPENVNVGILGRNGAGKSTLLRMLGGIDFPSFGEITSNKTFSWPMGLAGGFQGSMTGKQNVKFVCRIYGKAEEEIAQIIESVKEFAEIGDYFDLPIKTYSSGMKSRLSFGLSLAFDFDYLIIDEILSVGDENFKKKAKEALEKKFKTSNVLLVSHSMSQLKKICDCGIVINDGTLEYFQKIEDAISFYHQLNKTTPNKSGNKSQSSSIYCDDGNIFDNINETAKYYKVRPLSILQSLEKNAGSNLFLKKVFWKDGTKKLPYQEWQNIVKNETIISSDGVIFENALEASYFYMDKIPNADINTAYVDNIMKNENGISKKLNVKFYNLSEFK